ncbi:MAG: penicillin-binding transpeptidase domain-containing protein, partial [Elusimicrobiota bacterium]
MPSKKFYFWRQYGGRKQLWPSVVLISLWLIMFTRLVHLQIIRGSYYLNRAERNRTHYSYVQAPRGNIYDRRGELIAGNRPNYSLYVSIEGLRAEQAREIAFKLDELTGRGRENILRRLAELRGKRGVSNILFRHLSREEIILIEENHHDIPRVFIQINPIRKYPFSEGLSHFLGYVGEISAGELRAKKKYAYMLKDIIGKTGIEAEYDLELRGQRGYRIMEVSVDGSHRKVLDEKKPVQGKHLVTTIDASLQEAAFKAMGDDRGAVVAMNPKTGEVLTWLSTPGFDPQEFTVTFSRERVRDLFENPLNPLFDRTIKGQFSPGSIFKTVIALASLKEDPDSFETEYTCRGKIEIGFDRREFKCWKEEGHGSVDMTEALAQSCNIYFYLTGLKTGHENILEMARQVGLGKKVQDILPGEKSGLLPSRDWKRKRFGEILYPGDTANL